MNQKKSNALQPKEPTILEAFQRTSNKNYDNSKQASFSAFRSHYFASYSVLTDELKTEFNMGNLIGSVANLVLKIQSSDVNGNILSLVKDLISFNPNFGGKGKPSARHIAIFNQALETTRQLAETQVQNVDFEAAHVQQTQNDGNIAVILKDNFSNTDQQLLPNVERNETVNETPTNAIITEPSDDEAQKKKSLNYIKSLIKRKLTKTND